MKVKIGTFTDPLMVREESRKCSEAYEKQHPQFKYFGMKISRNGTKATLYACDNFNEAMDI